MPHGWPQKEYPTHNRSFNTAAPWVNESPFWFNAGDDICWTRRGVTQQGIVQGWWIDFKATRRDTITMLISTATGMVEQTFDAYDKRQAWTTEKEDA